MSTQETKLTAIADAIRQKEGSTGPIPAGDFAARILAIETGSAFAVPLTVTVEPGATVTAVNGEHTASGTAGEDGQVVLTLTAPGMWMVTGALDGKEKAITVEVLDGYFENLNVASRLPGGYTELEYIQSSTTQCIDTGIKPSNKIKIVMDVEPTEAGDSYTRSFFYSYAAFNGYYYYFRMTWTSTGIGANLGKGSSTTINISADITPRRMILQLDGSTKKAFVDDTEMTFTSNSFTNTMPSIKLLSGTYGVAAKLYSCQIYQVEELICDFVPCVNANGDAGLFNLVTSEFFANAGTGNLIPGPAV